MTGEKVVISLSPLHLRWEGNGYRMTLDQNTGQLSGYYPLKLVPHYEPETGTWGMLWVDQLHKPYTLAMEASADGHAHLLTTQPGGARVHALALRKGARYRLEVTPDGLPGPVTVDGGGSVAPVVLTGPAGDSELAAAQREYDEAFESYTRLVTTGGSGDVEAARVRYRQAHERLTRLKGSRATGAGR